MAPFVVDASASMPWCFEDEATAWSEGLLDLLSAGEQAHVPAHWPIEVSNGLRMASRRKRIQPARAEMFWDRLASLHIAVKPPLSPTQAKLVLALSGKHRLTVYDAAYLDLAQRRRIPLATLDDELIKAAPIESVKLMKASN